MRCLRLGQTLSSGGIRTITQLRHLEHQDFFIERLHSGNLQLQIGIFLRFWLLAKLWGDVVIECSPESRSSGWPSAYWMTTHFPFLAFDVWGRPVMDAKAA